MPRPTNHNLLGVSTEAPHPELFKLVHERHGSWVRRSSLIEQVRAVMMTRPSVVVVQTHEAEDDAPTQLIESVRRLNPRPTVCVWSAQQQLQHEHAARAAGADLYGSGLVGLHQLREALGTVPAPLSPTPTDRGVSGGWLVDTRDPP